MRIGEAGIELIKRYEGCRLRAYQDSVGVWTIGYGHTRGVASGMVITQAQADAFLRKDVKSVEDTINAQGYNLNQNQFDALVSLFFNVGTGHLKNFDTLLREEPDSLQVPLKILKYKYAGGSVLQGLVNRRTSEAALYQKKNVIMALSFVGLLLLIAAAYGIYYLVKKK